MLCANPQ